MEERAVGIILRTRPLTETSLIVQWLTADFGRISTVAKGARRPKSPFLGKLDLYYEADFTFSRARKSSLHTLREASLRDARPFFRTDLNALELAARAGRRIERTTEEETPLAEVYELFRGYLNESGKAPINEALTIGFEIKLLEILGFRPQLKGSGLNPGATSVFDRLEVLDWEPIHRIKLSASQIIDLAAFLDRAFQSAMA